MGMPKPGLSFICAGKGAGMKQLYLSAIIVLIVLGLLAAALWNFIH